MANATLKATFSISSTDLFDTVNLSKTVTDSLTIDGDNRQGLTTVKTSTSYLDMTVEALSGSTGGGKKAYVYAKNLDSTDDLIELEFTKDTGEYLKFKFDNYLTSSVDIPFPDDKGALEVSVTVSARTLATNGCQYNGNWIIWG